MLSLKRAFQQNSHFQGSSGFFCYNTVFFQSRTLSLTFHFFQLPFHSDPASMICLNRLAYRVLDSPPNLQSHDYTKTSLEHLCKRLIPSRLDLSRGSFIYQILTDSSCLREQNAPLRMTALHTAAGTQAGAVLANCSLQEELALVTPF